MLVAIRSILADKHSNGKLQIIESFDSSGKTAELSKMLSSKGLDSSLIVTET